MRRARGAAARSAHERGLQHGGLRPDRARFTDYNLFGGARRLDVSATVGNLFASALSTAGIFRRRRRGHVDHRAIGRRSSSRRGNASIDLKQPAFLRRASNSRVDRRVRAAHASTPAAVVIDRGYGGQPHVHALDRPPRAGESRLPLRGDARRGERRPYFCVNYGVCDTTTINTLRHAPAAVADRRSPAQVDRSDQPLNPTRGYTARLELENASQFTGSDYRYNRAFVDGAVYSGRRRTRPCSRRTSDPVGWRRCRGATSPA